LKARRVFKKNQNWLFKTNKPLNKGFRRPDLDVTLDVRKKAFSGLNYRHFATQRREALYRRGFFWQLSQNGRKYGALQKYIYKKRRKISTWVGLKNLKIKGRILGNVKKSRSQNVIAPKIFSATPTITVVIKKKERKHEYGWKRKVYPRKPKFRQNWQERRVGDSRGYSQNRWNHPRANEQNHSGFNKYYPSNFRNRSQGGAWKNNEKTCGINNSGARVYGNASADFKKFDRVAFQINKKPTYNVGVNKRFTGPGSQRKYSTAPEVSKNKKLSPAVKLRYFKRKKNKKGALKINQNNVTTQQSVKILTPVSIPKLSLATRIEKILYKTRLLKIRGAKKQSQQRCFRKKLIYSHYFRGRFVKKPKVKNKSIETT